MKSIITAFVFVVSVTLLPHTAVVAGETYAFDKQHTNILFSIKHLGLSNFYGQFNDFDGTLVLDTEEPSKSKVDVTIDAASIDTDVEALDKHLRSPDFFDTDKYPKITFKSTKVQQVSKDTYRVTGKLKMHGKTKKVSFDAKLNFNGPHPLSNFSEKYKGAHYAAFSAKTKILRSDFDMALYTPNLSDDVELIIEAEFRRQ